MDPIVKAECEARAKMYDAIAEFFTKASTVLIMVAEAVAKEAETKGRR